MENMNEFPLSTYKALQHIVVEQFSQQELFTNTERLLYNVFKEIEKKTCFIIGNAL